ncbi:hypothetical protein AXF42_Ash006805 [Apostasia shenzhenica]|uniref:Binding partner of ACD11 1 n=1 Tax=Apostasia shenzhenica TaxID=1088818 RepID=A0A2I0AJ66_9ASPA|nr:hypothetical protein AXF42_Ash006805 [Apostasia shenzhenica]
MAENAYCFLDGASGADLGLDGAVGFTMTVFLTNPMLFFASESDGSQVAYVTFKDTQGADTAVLLSVRLFSPLHVFYGRFHIWDSLFEDLVQMQGATIGDRSVIVTHAENYLLPPEACRPTSATLEASTVRRAEDIVSSMLAKGYVLGKDALNSAKAFDERHQLTSNASATVVSIDRRYGLSEKVIMGTAIMNEKLYDVDKRFQVSEMTKSAIAAAEQKVSTVSSTIMSNPYVITGASWISNAFNRVAKAAEDVNVMTREKVVKSEEEKKEIIYRDRKVMVSDFAQFQLDDSFGEPATVPVATSDEHKFSYHDYFVLSLPNAVILSVVYDPTIAV